MCAAMAADKYSPRRGPEMDERRANKERLSEERLESSPEVDRALYKQNNKRRIRRRSGLSINIDRLSVKLISNNQDLVQVILSNHYIN